MAKIEIDPNQKPFDFLSSVPTKTPAIIIGPKQNDFTPEKVISLKPKPTEENKSEEENPKRIAYKGTYLD